jgi:tRNA threonylcarbamoyladenosine biosynthesis protein TsaE
MERKISHSVRETMQAGAALSRCLKPGDIVCLFGGFGAGKTVFTKGLAQGLGIDPREVVSPSFVLIRLYEKGRLPLAHFDLYRLEKTEDILALGAEEYLYGGGVSVIEWPQHFGALLPEERLEVHIEAVPSASAHRRLCLRSFGKRFSGRIGCVFSHHKDRG